MTQSRQSLSARIAVADCETDPFNGTTDIKPFIWGFFDGESFKTFDDTDSFVDFIRGFSGVCFAHNGGKFDWHFILDKLDKRRKVHITNGRIARARIGKCEIRDSWSILPIPLGAYQKDSIEYWKFTAEHRGKYIDEITEYLRGDCVYLHRLISEFYARFPAQMTLASTSMKVWAQMSGREIPRASPGFDSTIRPFYFGGRVEAFSTGIITGEHTIADINSAYPAAMMKQHPWGFKYNVGTRIDDSAIERSFIRFTGLSRGALPVRMADKSLAFPERFGEYWATGHEIKSGLETNTIRIERITEVYEWLETIDFGEYITRFFEEKSRAKDKGDKEGYLFAKLFMNSLYGKFAANPAKYKEYKIDGQYNEPDAEWLPAGNIDGDYAFFARPIPPSAQRFFNVATAASITGRVRAYLLESLHAVTRPVYCDTDSIIAVEASNLTQSDTLGDWSVEARPDRLAIAGKKLYAAWQAGNVVKLASKGVRLSADEIEKVARGQTVSYNSLAPTFSIGRGRFITSRTIRGLTNGH